MTVEEILDQALRLPESDRARLAHDLLRSLDPPGEEIGEEEWERAWAAEIKVRSDAVHSGAADLVDAREALQRARDSLAERNRR